MDKNIKINENFARLFGFKKSNSMLLNENYASLIRLFNFVKDWLIYNDKSLDTTYKFFKNNYNQKIYTDLDFKLCYLFLEKYL